MTTKLDYIPWDEISEKNQQELKVHFKTIENIMETKLHYSREKSLAATKLEECWMWIGKAIKVDQEERADLKKKEFDEIYKKTGM